MYVEQCPQAPSACVWSYMWLSLAIRNTREWISPLDWYAPGRTREEVDNGLRQLAFLLRDDLAKKMTAEQIADAQKRAREWRPVRW